MSQSTLAIVCYCPRCDYFLKTAVQPDTVGSHLCVQCDGLMEVYIAQGAKEVVKWHSGEPTPMSAQSENARIEAALAAWYAEMGRGGTRAACMSAALAAAGTGEATDSEYEHWSYMMERRRPARPHPRPKPRPKPQS